MVLSSQMARPEMSRRNMASSRPRRSNFMWAMIAGTAALFIAGYVWHRYNTSANEAAAPAVTRHDVSDANINPPARIAPVKAEPPSLRIGGGASPEVAAPPAKPVDQGFVTGKAGGHTNLAAAQTAHASAMTALPLAQTQTPTPAASPAPSAPASPRPAAQPSTGSPPATPAPPATMPASRPNSPLADAMRLIEEDKLVQGRAALNRLLVNETSLSKADAQAVRDTLASVNHVLVFSPKPVPGDELTEIYTVAAGDIIARIAPKYKVPAAAIEEINGVDGRKLRIGQKLKMPRGPFHVVVNKSAFRLDLFLNDPAGSPVYVRSFSVGLGESGSTPLGKFGIKKGGKVANPGWTNPRTGENFAPDDPKNPIGDFWIPLEGAEPATKDIKGYGIHGTIQPESIGREMSMGCVRLGDADIKLLFKLLTDGESTVTIRP